MGYFLMTNDVECFSFEHNRYEPEVAQRVLREGLPQLLDLYDKYDVNATFFYTGNIVEIEPEVIDIVTERGNHELGCHGYSHELDCGFDCMSPAQQKEHLEKAKQIIEKTANTRVESFRAPALRIDKNTLPLAESLGFKIDSSISSQRFDVGLSFGSKNKVKWLFAPRGVYHPSRENPYARGDMKIIEIPISAFILPFIGTTQRGFTKLTGVIERIITKGAKRNLYHPVCFLTHPNEVLELREKEINLHYRSNNKASQFLQEDVRMKLKYRNLGKKNIELLKKMIEYFKQKELSSSTLKDYVKKINKKDKKGIEV